MDRVVVDLLVDAVQSAGYSMETHNMDLHRVQRQTDGNTLHGSIIKREVKSFVHGAMYGRYDG